MANKITQQFAVIDTFGADVTIKDKYCEVIMISVAAAGNAEIAKFKNKEGQLILMSGSSANTVDHLAPSQPITCYGLIYDDGGSTLEDGDIVIVHFA